MPIEFRNWSWGGSTVGWIIALVVLVVCIVLWINGRPLTPNEVLGLIAALAVCRLV